MSRIEIISAPDALMAISEEWDAALLRNGAQDFSLTSHWLTTFLTAFDFGQGARILCVRDDTGAIIGQGAFMLTRTRGLSVLSSLTNLVGNRSSIVATGAGMRAVTDWMAGQPVAAMRIGRCAPDEVLRAHLPSVQTGQSYQLPIIATQTGFEAFLAGRSSNFKKSLKRARSKSRTHQITVQPIEGPSQRDVEAMLGVSQKTWKFEAGTAIASDPQVQRFFTGLAQAGGSQNPLRTVLFLMRNKASEAVAFMFCISFNHVLYALKMGYDPAMRDISPGFALLDAVTQYAMDAPQIVRVDLDAVGARGDYKLRWATDLLSLETCLGFPPTYLGRFGQAVWSAKALAGRAKHKLVGNSGTVEK